MTQQARQQQPGRQKTGKVGNERSRTPASVSPGQVCRHSEATLHGNARGWDRRGLRHDLTSFRLTLLLGLGSGHDGQTRGRSFANNAGPGVGYVSFGSVEGFLAPFLGLPCAFVSKCLGLNSFGRGLASYQWG